MERALLVLGARAGKAVWSGFKVLDRLGEAVLEAGGSLFDWGTLDVGVAVAVVLAGDSVSTSFSTFAGRAGAVSKAIPAFCIARAAEAVVTTVVSVLVVDVGGLGVLENGDFSKLLKEVGEPGWGGNALSSERRVDFVLARLVERRRSIEGFEVGGGILMLALAADVVIVSVWGNRRRSAALVAANRECVDRVLSGRGALELPEDEVVKTGAKPASSEPFVGVLANCVSIFKERS
jgi:hypothetical protein